MGLHRPSLILALVLGISALLVAACDDDDSPGGGGGLGDGGTNGSSGGTSSGTTSAPTTASPQDVTDFCDKTLGIVVGALEQCCNDTDKQQQLYKLTHDLAELLTPGCKLTLANSASKGRVLTRSDRASECYAAIAANYAPGKCGNITQTFSDPSGAACKEAFLGTVPEGAGCLGDHECIDGLTCVGYTDSEDGKCTRPPAIGAACGQAPNEAGATISSTSLGFGTHPSCAAGAHCDDVTHRCAGGDPKTPGAEGAACTSFDDCAGGTFCANDTHVCTKSRPAGGDCTGNTFTSGECAGRCDAANGQPGKCVAFCGSL